MKIFLFLLVNVLFLILIANVFFNAGRTSMANDLAIRVSSFPANDYSGDQKEKVLFLKKALSKSGITLNGSEFIRNLEVLLQDEKKGGRMESENLP